NDSFSNLRKRNFAQNSRIRYVPPYSIYVYMPKSGIKQDKSKEISREFTVKLSTFPSQLNRSFSKSQNQVPCDAKQSSSNANQSTSMGNGNVCQSSEGPAKSSGSAAVANQFSRSANKRPMTFSDHDHETDDVLFKRSKNADVIIEDDFEDDDDD